METPVFSSPPLTRVLIVLVSDTFADERWHPNLKTLPDAIMPSTDKIAVDMIAIASKEEDLPECGGSWACGKKSLACENMQLMKMCRAIKEWRERNPGLRYDWYIKSRPDIQLHSPLNILAFIPGCINARARCYKGPCWLRKAASVGGDDKWGPYRDEFLIPSPKEEGVVMDDQIYSFDSQVAESRVFDDTTMPPSPLQHEWYHTMVWMARGAKFAVMSVDCTLLKHGVSSGDLWGWPPRPFSQEGAEMSET